MQVQMVRIKVKSNNERAMQLASHHSRKPTRHTEYKWMWLRLFHPNPGIHCDTKAHTPDIDIGSTLCHLCHHKILWSRARHNISWFSFCFLFCFLCLCLVFSCAASLGFLLLGIFSTFLFLFLVLAFLFSRDSTCLLFLVVLLHEL